MDAINALPVISVVIPTFNRASLLYACLESLQHQSLPLDQYEVVVVDDGSADETREVCSSFPTQFQIRYLPIRHAGTSAGKNLGIFSSRGPVTLLFDDDDIAERTLLQTHVQSHQRHPEEEVAILGYTTWAPHLAVTEVMHYVMDVGQFLFSYGKLKDGQVLDFTHFWTGRISCKRTFLAKRGVFNQLIQPAYEDIELGYRLSLHGLKIHFNRAAVSYMNRPLTYDAFCRRCEVQGASQRLVRQFHSDPILDQHVRVLGAEEAWEGLRHTLSQKVRRVRELEVVLPGADDSGRDMIRAELHQLYRETFVAYRIKGYAEAEEAARKMAC